MSETVGELFDRIGGGGTVRVDNVYFHRPDGQQDRPVVIQPRCVHCGLEHYAPAVIAISHGNGACHNCGHAAPVFTDVEHYRSAVRRARSRS